MDKNKKIIENAYKNPLILGNSTKLYKYLKEHGYNVPLREINEYASKQETFQVSRPRDNKYYSFVAEEPRYQYQIDLVYMPRAWFNSGYKYIFTCVDIFSKKGAMIPMKKRDSAASAAAFKKILVDMGGPPKTIYSDQGSEFRNADFNKVLKDNNITIIFALDHAPFIESFNKTIKTRLYKYMLLYDTRQWFKILPILVEAYNDTEHSSTLFKPNDAVLDTNKAQVRFNMMKRAKRKDYEDIKVGDSVRIPIISKIKKGYKQQWSYQLHTAEEVIKKQGLYKVNGQLYPRKELQRVDDLTVENKKPEQVNTSKAAAERRQERVGQAKDSKLLKEIVDKISNKAVNEMIQSKRMTLRPRKTTRRTG